MKHNTLIYSLIVGVISILFKSIIVYFYPDWLYTFSFKLVTILLIGLVIWIAIKKHMNTEVEFRNILKYGFVIFLIGNGIAHIFDMYLYNIWKPELITMEKNAMIQYLSQGKGTSETNQLRNDIMSNNFHDWSTTLFEMVRGAVGGFVLVGIITFIFKKFSL